MTTIGMSKLDTTPLAALANERPSGGSPPSLSAGSTTIGTSLIDRFLAPFGSWPTASLTPVQ